MKEEKCPKCEGKMEKKGWIPDEDSDGYQTSMKIYQCEDCKNIEII